MYKCIIINFGVRVLNILLIANEQKDKDFALANEIVNLIGNRANVCVEDNLLNKKISNVHYIPQEKFSEMDVFLVLGGDGTLLSVSKISARLNIPVVGVNLGRLGFLAEIEKSNIKDDIDKLLSGEYQLQERAMLSVKNQENNALALNDIIITRENSLLKILEFDVYLDDEFVDHFMADGVIISTPTGSTAYSLSAGGPIADPSMDIMIITPICPHKMYSRTIIVPGNKKITIKNRSTDDSKAVVAADSQMFVTIKSGESVVISAAKERFKLIKLHGFKFFSALHDKLIKKEN